MVHDADRRENPAGNGDQNVGKEQIARRRRPVLDRAGITGQLCYMFRDQTPHELDQIVQLVFGTCRLFQKPREEIRILLEVRYYDSSHHYIGRHVFIFVNIRQQSIEISIVVFLITETLQILDVTAV